MTAIARVYVDACVLIKAASAAEEEVATRALQELDREDVTYLFSSVVEHEVLPQPILNGREDEIAFFQAFFEGAEKVPCDSGQQEAAFAMRLDSRGLSLVDAFHLSAASSAGAHEFVTAEKSSKPKVASPPAQIGTMKVRTIALDPQAAGATSGTALS